MKKHVLVFCGDRWHHAEDTMGALATLDGYDCRQAAGEADLEDLASVDVVLLAKLNMRLADDAQPWLTEKGEAALVNFVHRGGAVLFVHGGTAGYADLDDLRRVRGGTFLHHPEPCEVSVRVASDHPLTRGVASFEITDEHYHMVVDEGIDVFLTTGSVHGTQPAGWTQLFGFGRVCVLTPGHSAEVWGHAGFLQLLQNALDWVSDTAHRTVLVTGADRGLGLAVCEALLQRRWRVLAGQFMPDWPELEKLESEHPETLRRIPLDVGDDASPREAAKLAGEWTDSLELLISNAGVMAPDYQRNIRQEPSFANMNRELNINAVGPLRVVEAFLPLLDRGAGKTLCFVSSEAGSIGQSGRTSWYGYCMSKAALNVAAKNLENVLQPDGYTIKVYHPGYVRGYMHGTKNLEAYLEPEEAAVHAVNFFLAPRAPGPLALTDFEGVRLPW
jgi:NAD(P)-dependent dehydrogenase (short-subunit alcohol dehydrogenase family)/type 1 glutamine amidotransferase